MLQLLVELAQYHFGTIRSFREGNAQVIRASGNAKIAHQQMGDLCIQSPFNLFDYFLVAGPRIALGHQGYEPCMQLLHLPAIASLHIVSCLWYVHTYHAPYISRPEND